LLVLAEIGVQKFVGTFVENIQHRCWKPTDSVEVFNGELRSSLFFREFSIIRFLQKSELPLLSIGKDRNTGLNLPPSRQIHSISAQKSVAAFRVFGTRTAIPKRTNDVSGNFSRAD
jgi:hypothetical protein